MGVSTELRDCEKEAGTYRSGCADVVGQKLTGAKRRERGNGGNGMIVNGCGLGHSSHSLRLDV